MRIRESLIDMDQIAVGSGNELGGTAVFFDLENIILGIHESFKVQKIIDHLTERGEVMIRRAYADWGRYRQYQRQFLEEGVQMVFLPSYGTSDKNRTDTAICVDAMEILFRREHIDTFVICSGDSDFGVLAQRLRDYGKRIVGISARSAASQILVKQCHEFIFYESLVGLAMKDYSRDEGEARMKRALVQLVDEYGRQFRASLLKDRMRKQDSTFSEKNYGASNFTRFLKSYARVVRVLDGGKVEVLWTPEPDFRESVSPRSNGAAPARGPGGRSGATRAPATPSPAALSPPLSTPPALPAAPPAPSAKPASAPAEAVQPEKMTPQRKQEIAALLERAFAQSLGSAASIRMGQLKETLVGMSPGFDEGRLGFRSFASFLKAFPTVVTLDRYRDDVRPVGTDVPSATSPEVVPIVDTETAAPGPVEPVSAAVALAETEAKEAVIRKSARRATAKKDTAKKNTAKKTTAKKTTAKKTTAKKDTAKKDTAKKDTPKKASAQKAPDPASDR